MALDILDRPAMTRVLFHPRRDPGPAPNQPGLRLVQVPVAAGVVVAGRLHFEQPDAPLVLFFHGNGETAADYDDLAPFYRHIGVSLLVMDYRGYGASTGTPTATTLLTDAVAVWQALPALLQAQGLAPRRLYVLGRSLGSAAALAVAEAAGPAVAGMILDSAFAETWPLVERLGGMRPAGVSEERDGFGNLARIRTLTQPVLLLHGEEDWIIPFSDAEQLFDACPSPVRTLVPIRGAGHNDLLYRGLETYFQAVGAMTRD